MENSVQNHIFKFSTELSPPHHNEARCGASNESTIREEFRILSVSSNENWEEISDMAVVSKVLPKLGRITTKGEQNNTNNNNNVPSSSMLNNCVDVFENNNQPSEATTIAQNLNGMSQPPKLTPIVGSSQAVIPSFDQFNINNNMDDANILRQFYVINNNIPQTNTNTNEPMSANTSQISDVSLLNNTINNCGGLPQNPINNYSNSNSNDFMNYQQQSSQNDNQVINQFNQIGNEIAQNNMDGESNTVNSPNNNNNNSNDSQHYRNITKFDLLGNVDSILAGDTNIETLAYADQVFGIDTTTNLNTSAAFGDDNIFTVDTHSQQRVNRADQLTFPNMNSNGSNHTTSFELNNHDYLDAMGGAYNPNDPNNIFTNDSMITKHFYDNGSEYPPSSNYVIAQPPGSNNNSFNNVFNQSTNFDPIANSFNNNMQAFENGTFNYSNGFNFPINSIMPSPHHYATAYLDRAGGNHSSFRRAGKSPSTTRRRQSANDPQSTAKRHNHNMLERKRRSELRNNFTRLIELLPAIRNQPPNRLSKVKILEATINYVRTYTVKDRHYKRLHEEKQRLINTICENIRNYVPMTNNQLLYPIAE